MARGRGPVDDLKWGVAVLAGFALGALVFGADWSIVVGALIGVMFVALVRAVRRRRGRRQPRA
jgi:membrane protein implicated in regulation of membrane protease activity